MKVAAAMAAASKMNSTPITAGVKRNLNILITLI
jgi:hypothetical protein